MESTLHIQERKDRVSFIKETIGVGKPVRTFLVDKGHPNGPELHTVTTTGIIVIHNARTKKLVTLLIARPGQVERYWKNLSLEAPIELMEIARNHQIAGYNYK